MHLAVTSDPDAIGTRDGDGIIEQHSLTLSERADLTQVGTDQVAPRAVSTNGMKVAIDHGPGLDDDCGKLILRQVIAVVWAHRSAGNDLTVDEGRVSGLHIEDRVENSALFAMMSQVDRLAEVRSPSYTLKLVDGVNMLVTPAKEKRLDKSRGENPIVMKIELFL